MTNDEVVRLPRVIGSPATGQSFYGRENTINEIWQRLDSNSILLVAPRRFGKTSIMRNLEAHPRSKIAVIFLDVEDVVSPSEYIARIILALSVFWKKDFGEKLKDALSILQTSVEELDFAQVSIKLRIQLEEGWKEKANAVLMKMSGVDQKLIVIIDEFPEMLHSMRKSSIPESQIRELLFWNRALRISLANIRYVIGGSIGIDRIVRGVNASPSINDLERISVGPFSHDEARRFVKGLFAGESLAANDDIVDAVLEHVELAIPYFIQVLLSAIVREVKVNGKLLTRDLVDQAYRNDLLGSSCYNYFDHYFTRLKEYYSAKDLETVRRMMTHLARRKQATNGEMFNLFKQVQQSDDRELFNNLMSDLENEFYISYSEGTFNFSSSVMRELWIRHYGE